MGHALQFTDHNSLKVFLRTMVVADNKTGKDLSPLSELITAGNIKIPSTTGIFNMGSATDCPSKAMGFCQAVVKGKSVCYAKKAEVAYRPDVLPFRRRQEEYWKNTSAERFATDFIMLNMFKARRPFNALRFNESGDFWSQECVDKAERIASILKRYGVTCYCYTSRKDLDFSHCHNLVVHGSGFKHEGMRGTFLMVLNKKDRPSGFGICKGSCKECKRCLVGRNTIIIRH